MPAGRPRKPTKLKVVAGTERPSRANPNEPDAPAGRPVAPAWLSSRAAAIYVGLCDLIEGMGYLSTADGDILAQCASRLEEVEITTAMVEDGGRTYITSQEFDGEGRVVKQMIRGHPVVAQRSEAMRHAHSLLSELGLTPAARSKVSATKQQETNPFAALMG